jgi:hypothetical protein
VATYSATAITRAGVAAAPAAVSVSDTIPGSLATAGVILEVKNGSGGSINVTFVDPGLTPAGNTGTNAAIAVAAGATKRFKLSTAFVDSSTGNITVNYSSATSVTWELYYA